MKVADSGSFSSSSSSSWPAGAAILRSGGALCDRVGRCLGLDFQVLTGGESRLESTTLGVRDLLGGDAGETKSVSTGGKTWGLRWSASTSSISVSRVTMIGLLKGREVRLPKVKSLVSGYKGNGETSTVRSVMVVVQNKVKIFADTLCDGRRHF